MIPIKEKLIQNCASNFDDIDHINLFIQGFSVFKSFIENNKFQEQPDIRIQYFSNVSFILKNIATLFKYLQNDYNGFKMSELDASQSPRAITITKTNKNNELKNVEALNGERRAKYLLSIEGDEMILITKIISEMKTETALYYLSYLHKYCSMYTDEDLINCILSEKSFNYKECGNSTLLCEWLRNNRSNKKLVITLLNILLDLINKNKKEIEPLLLKIKCNKSLVYLCEIFMKYTKHLDISNLILEILITICQNDTRRKGINCLGFVFHVSKPSMIKYFVKSLENSLKYKHESLFYNLCNTKYLMSKSNYCQLSDIQTNNKDFAAQILKLILNGFNVFLLKTNCNVNSENEVLIVNMLNAICSMISGQDECKLKMSEYDGIMKIINILTVYFEHEKIVESCCKVLNITVEGQLIKIDDILQDKHEEKHKLITTILKCLIKYGHSSKITEPSLLLLIKMANIITYDEENPKGIKKGVCQLVNSDINNIVDQILLKQKNNLGIKLVINQLMNIVNNCNETYELQESEGQEKINSPLNCTSVGVGSGPSLLKDNGNGNLSLNNMVKSRSRSRKRENSRASRIIALKNRSPVRLTKEFGDQASLQRRARSVRFLSEKQNFLRSNSDDKTERHTATKLL